MLATKGMHFPNDMILVCIRWYCAYPLSYWHLEKMIDQADAQFEVISIGQKCIGWHRVDAHDSQRSAHDGELQREVFCRPFLCIGRGKSVPSEHLALVTAKNTFLSSQSDTTVWCDSSQP